MSKVMSKSHMSWARHSQICVCVVVETKAAAGGQDRQGTNKARSWHAEGLNTTANKPAHTHTQSGKEKLNMLVVFVGECRVLA